MKHLTLEQLKVVADKTLENAKELIEEAEILLDNKRYSRVLFLSQIAGEEIGKYLLLKSTMVSLATEQIINWKLFWKQYKSHKEKLKYVTYFEDVLLEQISKNKSIKEYYGELKSQVFMLDEHKQKSLYSDFTEEIAHKPKDVVTKQMATDSLKWARGRFGLFSELYRKTRENKTIDKITKKDFLDFIEERGLTKFYSKYRIW